MRSRTSGATATRLRRPGGRARGSTRSPSTRSRTRKPSWVSVSDSVGELAGALRATDSKLSIAAMIAGQSRAIRSAGSTIGADRGRERRRPRRRRRRRGTRTAPPVRSRWNATSSSRTSSAWRPSTGPERSATSPARQRAGDEVERAVDLAARARPARRSPRRARSGRGPRPARRLESARERRIASRTVHSSRTASACCGYRRDPATVVEAPVSVPHPVREAIGPASRRGPRSCHRGRVPAPTIARALSGHALSRGAARRRGRGTPVQRSNASAAWWTSIPSPPTVGRPDAAAAAAGTASRPGGTRGRRPTGRARARTGRLRRRPCRAASRSPRRRSHRPGPGPVERASTPGAAARAATAAASPRGPRPCTRAPAPDRARAPTARAAPPAPSTSDRAARRVEPGVGEAERRNPSPSVESPSSEPSSRHDDGVHRLRARRRRR